MTWSELQDKHSKLSIREKSLILITALVLVIFTVVNFIIEPLFVRYENLTKQTEATMQSINAVTLQVQNIDTKLASDPLAQLQTELDSLVEQHNQQIVLLDEYQLSLVESDEMSNLIEELVDENKHLSVMSLRSQPPKAILVQDSEKTKETLLYKHAIAITLKGRYFSLLKFMQKLETKEKSVLWSDIDYRVEEYPNAIISFEIYTVSTDKEFIGVKG